MRWKTTDTQGISQPKAIQGKYEPKNFSRLGSNTYRQAYQLCFSETPHESLRRDLQYSSELLKRTVPCKEDYQPDDDGYDHITSSDLGVFNKQRARTKLSNGQGSDQNREPPVLLLANQPYTPSIEWLYDECYDTTRIWSLNPRVIRGGLPKYSQFHNNDLHLSKEISCQGVNMPRAGGTHIGIMPTIVGSARRVRLIQVNRSED